MKKNRRKNKVTKKHYSLRCSLTFICAMHRYSLVARLALQSTVKGDKKQKWKGNKRVFFFLFFVFVLSSVSVFPPHLLITSYNLSRHRSTEVAKARQTIGRAGDWLSCFGWFNVWRSTSRYLMITFKSEKQERKEFDKMKPFATAFSAALSQTSDGASSPHSTNDPAAEARRVFLKSVLPNNYLLIFRASLLIHHYQKVERFAVSDGRTDAMLWWTTNEINSSCPISRIFHSGRTSLGLSYRLIARYRSNWKFRYLLLKRQNCLSRIEEKVLDCLRSLHLRHQSWLTTLSRLKPDLNPGFYILMFTVFA